MVAREGGGETLVVDVVADAVVVADRVAAVEA